MITSIGIALTGLNSASLRLNASASNITNVSTANSLTDQNNAPYAPLTTNQPFTPIFDSDSPSTDLASDIINMKLAEISYKANLSTIKVAGRMFDELLNATDNKS